MPTSISKREGEVVVGNENNPPKEDKERLLMFSAPPQCYQFEDCVPW
jgi:hypothetical protein